MEDLVQAEHSRIGARGAGRRADEDGERVDDGPPHTVTQWTVASITPPDSGDTKRLSDEEIAARADAYLTKLAAADLFSGSVVVAHDGKPILSRAYGLASRA